MTGRHFQDRIVAFKDNDTYVAVSLNFDIVAEGDNVEQAIERLRDATLGYLVVCVEDKEKDEAIYKSAPKEYQDMWDDVFDISKFNPPKSQKGLLKKKEKEMLKKEVQARTESYIPTIV